MSDFERILLECRYILSLNKNYYDLASIFHVNMNTIYHDLNVKLPKFDSILYKRVKMVLKKQNSS